MVRALPFLLLTGCVRVLVADDTVTFLDPVERVVADLDAGDVEIVGADVDEVRVDRHVEHTEGAAPELEATLEDGVLTLRARCADTFFESCFADHRVVLPAAVAVEIRTGAGDVRVSNVAGPLEANTGAGDVAVTDVAGAVTLDTGSGDIALGGATGAVAATTGSGDITADALAAGVVQVDTGAGDVALRVTASIASIDAESGAGDVELRVPAGPYALDAGAGSGDVEVLGVTDDPAAAPLCARSGAGDVRVVGE